MQDIEAKNFSASWKTNLISRMKNRRNILNNKIGNVVAYRKVLSHLFSVVAED
jgi:hypothetical protein